MTSQERQKQTIDSLNSLYAAETKSLLPRLGEMGVFVQWAQAHEMDLVRRMTAEEARHVEWLAEAAEKADGALAPACADVHTANLHYCDLRVLLPMVIANVQMLVDLYGQALKERASLTDQAADTITRIYNRHQVHIEQLRSIQARFAARQSA